MMSVMTGNTETKSNESPVTCDVSFVIPAHNEAPTIRQVVQACIAAITELNVSGEVIVVSDCSTDGTAALARTSGAVVIDRRAPNGSKSRAILLGVERAHGRFLFFVDGDLLGVQGSHLADIARPALNGAALMSVGTFDYRYVKRLVQRAPWSTGERIVPREVFDSSDTRLSGYNVEMILNERIGLLHGHTASQTMRGVRQRNKAQKTSLLKGIVSNLAMWTEIAHSARHIRLGSYLQYARAVHLYDPCTKESKRQSWLVTSGCAWTMQGAFRVLQLLG